MPSHRGPSKLRKVPLRVASGTGDTAVSGLSYAFRGKIDAADATKLGQEDITQVEGEGIVFGCNYPKPATMAKDYATGTVSSFVDEASRATALAAKWYPKESATLAMQPHDTARAVAVYTEVNGVDYGWFMQKATWTKIGGAGNSFGIKLVTSSDKFVCYGCTVPKPARLKLSEYDGGIFSTWSTWGDGTTPAADLGDWKVAVAPRIALK